MEELPNGKTNKIRYVRVNLTRDATVIFENITSTNMNRIINIYLDDELLFSSTINNVICSGEFHIPVHNEEQGEELAFKLQNSKR